VTRLTVVYPVNELRVGGAEQQLLELVRGLDKNRFHPVVAALYGGGALEAEFRAVPGLEVVALNRRGRYDFSPLRTLGRLLQTREAAIVQPFLSPATFFGLVPALVLGIPVKVVTERCGVRRRRHLGYHMYRTAEDILTNFADAVVANSQAGRDLLLSRGIRADRIRVIYNGVGPARREPNPAETAAIQAQLGLPSRGHVVGIVASLTPAKDPPTFLRAAAIIARSRPDLRFAVVGDGPLRAALEALAESLGIRAATVFFGYRRDVANFLGVFSVLVSSSCDNEGSSNSILEAMAAGVPVVATAVGGTQELVRSGETGLLVEPGNSAALATAIDETLADRAAAERRAERARLMVRDRFSVEQMVGGYENLYVELLAAKGFGKGQTEGRQVTGGVGG